MRSAMLSAKGGGSPALDRLARDEVRTGLPAYAPVELILRVGMDRIECGRSVEHFSRGRSAARRDRRRFAGLADVGEDALDWATIERLLSVGLLPLKFWRRMSALGRDLPFALPLTSGHCKEF